MSQAKKPLFSRPFLSALMVIIPAMVLLLNVTSKEKHYSMPDIYTWKTSTGIPVTWLTLDEWRPQDNLEIRILFNHGYSNDLKLSLTDATFELLLRDTLPLSTTSINDRLKLLGATIKYKVQSNRSELAITMDGHPSLLLPSLDFLNLWLPKPDFKQRTFSNWKHPDRQQSQIKQQLLNATFDTLSNHTSTRSFNESITIEDINNSYQELKKHVSKIVFVGSVSNIEEFKQQIDSISNSFSVTAPMSNREDPTQTMSLQANEGLNLVESYAAVAIPQLSQPKEWFTLQFWATYLLKEIHSDNIANHVELHIEASQPAPWIWWRIMHAPNILQSSNYPISGSDKLSYYSKTLLEQTLLEEDVFNTTVDLFQERMQQQSKQTKWWANIASNVSSGNEQALQNWINTYSLQLNEFSFTVYQEELERLIQTSRLHEVQIRQ